MPSFNPTFPLSRALSYAPSPALLRPARNTTPLPFLRFATTMNGALNPNSISAVGTVNTHAFRVPILIAQDCARLVLSFSNWGTTNAGDVNGANAATVIDCAIDSGTATSAALFSGASGIVLNPGDNDIHSDAINPPTGKTRFTRGEIYYVKGKISCPASGKLSYAFENSGAYAGTTSVIYDPAASTVSATLTPGVYTSTGTAPTAVAFPFKPNVLGYPYVDNPCYFSIGDSILQGFGDTATNLLNGLGFFQRALTDVDLISNPLPGANFSQSGNSTNSWTNGNKWINHIQYANIGINELGTNDVGVSNAAILDALTALQLQIVQSFRLKGIRRIQRPQLLARTSSTDNFATAVNQTPVSGWASGQNAPNLSAWFSTKIAGQTYESVISSAVLRDSGNPLVWATTGIANATTPDGTHPASASHIAWGSVVRTALQALPASGPAPSILPPVLNPSDLSSVGNTTLSNSNKTVTHTGAASASSLARGTTPIVSGDKKYFECHIDNNLSGISICIADLAAPLNGNNNVHCVFYAASGLVGGAGVSSSSIATYTTGDTICCALDYSDPAAIKIAWRKNGGNWNNNVANDPTVGNYTMTGIVAGVELFPGLSTFVQNEALTVAFSGFAFAVPSGYSAIAGGGV